MHKQIGILINKQISKYTQQIDKYIRKHTNQQTDKMKQMSANKRNIRRKSPAFLKKRGKSTPSSILWHRIITTISRAFPRAERRPPLPSFHDLLLHSKPVQPMDPPTYNERSSQVQFETLLLIRSGVSSKTNFRPRESYQSFFLSRVAVTEGYKGKTRMCSVVGKD